MDTLVEEYKRSWDDKQDAWTKRGDAVDFALFLAGELGINPKGVMVDKDGKLYRVFVPLLSRYWAPMALLTPKDGLMPISWERTLSEFKQELKSWASV